MNFTACERMTPALIDMVPELERSFGLYQPGRFMWMLEDVKPFDTPIPAKGALSLWDYDLSA